MKHSIIIWSAWVVSCIIMLGMTFWFNYNLLWMKQTLSLLDQLHLVQELAFHFILNLILAPFTICSFYYIIHPSAWKIGKEEIQQIYKAQKNTFKQEDIYMQIGRCECLHAKVCMFVGYLWEQEEVQEHNSTPWEQDCVC